MKGSCENWFLTRQSFEISQFFFNVEAFIGKIHTITALLLFLLFGETLTLKIIYPQNFFQLVMCINPNEN